MNNWEIPLLKLMLLSRESDIREAILVRQGKALTHVSSAGHEALMAITSQLSSEDYLYPYYRGAHLMLGKGLSREVIARDFFMKETSSSRGRSSSPHTSSVALKIFPTAASTGSQCLPAVGTAWGQKIRHRGGITVCSIGDGAVREGDFYEAVCFAVQNSLPIIFIIEDNHYAISTNTTNMMPFRLNIFDEQLYVRVDGTDVFKVHDAAQRALLQVREGRGPAILWCEIDRLLSHTASDDHRLYRAENELNNLVDPIEKFVEMLITRNKLSKKEFEKMRQIARDEILQMYKLAEMDPDPTETDLTLHLYGEKVDHLPVPMLNGVDELNMVESINYIFEQGLKSFPELLFFGEDIEDPKGGVFNLTKGLSAKYPGRVINSPLAESTIIGSAVGLSTFGFKPIFEIQFIDFITPGFDQLVTQVSSLRWRSCGQWKCPLVLYAPYGAYLPAGGLWHSQSNDGWWAHIPGLRVAIPSTPQDAIELFWAAFQDEDPSLILIPKHIFRQRMPIEVRQLLPFGKARIVRDGNMVTIVAWGNTVELALSAATHVAKEGISVEVIDLRTLVPCDWETIANSLAKTGRLVVVHEDNRTCGFGATVVSEMTTNPAYFHYLFSAPQIVARNDVHIPFHPKLEYTVLPSMNDICKAIYITLGAD